MPYSDTREVFTGKILCVSGTKRSGDLFEAIWEDFPDLRNGGRLVVMPLADFRAIVELLRGASAVPLEHAIAFHIPPKPAQDERIEPKALRRSKAGVWERIKRAFWHENRKDDE